jgi:hypothetical protein
MRPDVLGMPVMGIPVTRPLAGEMAATLWSLRGFLATLMAALAAKAAVIPAYAWATGRLVEAIRAPEATILGVIAAIGPLFAAIILAVAVVEFGEKVASKAMEARLLVVLQRVFLARRQVEHAARDVSQVLYGCDVARKGFEAVYKDGWRIPAEVIGVLAWQLTLGAGWVPLMLGALVPALGCVWLIGKRLELVSLQILGWQARIAATTGAAERGRFTETQERIFRGSIRFEILKWLTERGLDAALWTFLALSALAAWALDPRLLPGESELAGAAVFAVNLRLLAKPLSDVGKVYTKWREALPAIRTVYRPSEEAVPR